MTAGFEIRPAVRESVPLLLGVAGGTGSGKTYSAMRVASGIVRVVAPGKRFAVIDTENRRSRHYADNFGFDVLDLEPPFAPSRYQKAFEAVEAAGYPVIVVDSASHEHAGEGGILDLADEELARFSRGRRDGGDDERADDRNAMRKWIEPKRQHKRFVGALLRARAHVILAFRAEPKVEMVKDERGRTVVREKLTGGAQKALAGWWPIAEKGLPFELTASFLLLADAPGVPHAIKLPESLRKLVDMTKPLDEDTGARFAEWARGAPAERPAASVIGQADMNRLGEAAKRRAAELGGESDAASILKSALGQFGFSTRAAVTVDRVDEVLELVENWSRGDEP